MTIFTNKKLYLLDIWLYKEPLDLNIGAISDNFMSRGNLASRSLTIENNDTVYNSVRLVHLCDFLEIVT